MGMSPGGWPRFMVAPTTWPGSRRQRGRHECGGFPLRRCDPLGGIFHCGGVFDCGGVIHASVEGQQFSRGVFRICTFKVRARAIEGQLRVAGLHKYDLLEDGPQDHTPPARPASPWFGRSLGPRGGCAASRAAQPCHQVCGHHNDTALSTLRGMQNLQQYDTSHAGPCPPAVGRPPLAY